MSWHATPKGGEFTAALLTAKLSEGNIETVKASVVAPNLAEALAEFIRLSVADKTGRWQTSVGDLKIVPARALYVVVQEYKKALDTAVAAPDLPTLTAFYALENLKLASIERVQALVDSGDVPDAYASGFRLLQGDLGLKPPHDALTEERKNAIPLKLLDELYGAGDRERARLKENLISQHRGEIARLINDHEARMRDIQMKFDEENADLLIQENQLANEMRKSKEESDNFINDDGEDDIEIYNEMFVPLAKRDLYEAFSGSFLAGKLSGRFKEHKFSEQIGRKLYIDCDLEVLRYINEFVLGSKFKKETPYKELIAQVQDYVRPKFHARTSAEVDAEIDYLLGRQ